MGAFSLLKGTSGNDILIARALENDLSGNGGSDVLVGNPHGKNTFRIDTLDQVFSYKGDIFVSAS